VTAPPVAQIRARPGTIRLAAPNEPALVLRVEVPEVWDVVRIEAPPTLPVAELKRRALDALVPGGPDPAQWVVKLRGFEVLDEQSALSAAGALDGSTFLITRRRRTPVK
jgi:hypothetical protein